MNKNKKVAVITGAASGIGLALTKVCLANNMQVVMADNAEAVLSSQIAALSDTHRAEVLPILCDVSQFDQVEHLAQQTIAHFGQVDLLINNAGISGYLAPLWEQTNAQIRQVLDINLYGVIHGVQAFLPWMFKQTQRARIVNMASFYGLCSGSQMATYGMSKHAIVALSESLYFDLRRLNKPVDVSVVCPSFANTQLLANSSPSTPDKFHQMMHALIERSRPTEDIANHIFSALHNNTFYILPDKEVKNYCEQRMQAIIEQTPPHEHSIERIIASLSQRARKID